MTSGGAVIITVRWGTGRGPDHDEDDDEDDNDDNDNDMARDWGS